MTPLVNIAMFGCIPLVLCIMWCMPPRVGVLVAMIGAWLFLPQAEFIFSGLPKYTKMFATCLGLVLGCAAFHSGLIVRFRFKWFDIPMILWCFAPLFSSLDNGMGPRDGLMESASQIILWGAPYMIGRLYFCDLDGIDMLAKGLIIGTLIYVPLCLYELRMSPQLHAMVYGFHPHSDFAQSFRYGGYRPVVFMQHGLMVGMWMCCGALAALWMWNTGKMKKIGPLPMWMVVPILLAMAVLVKSTGALVLMAVGIVIMYAIRFCKLRFIVLIVVAAVPLYIGLRTSGKIHGEAITEWVTKYFGEDRAGSLDFRFKNENMLIDKAVQQPIFGWAGWGRARIIDPMTGKDLAVTDGLWIIALGNNGVFGVAMLFTAMLLPTSRFIYNFKSRIWKEPAYASASAFAIISLMYAIDCLPNGMVNPVFVLGVGALNGLALLPRAVRRGFEILPPQDDETFSNVSGGAGWGVTDHGDYVRA